PILIETKPAEICATKGAEFLRSARTSFGAYSQLTPKPIEWILSRRRALRCREIQRGCPFLITTLQWRGPFRLLLNDVVEQIESRSKHLIKSSQGSKRRRPNCFPNRILQILPSDVCLTS